MSSRKPSSASTPASKPQRAARKRLAMALEQRFLLDAAAVETLAETAAQQAAQEAAQESARHASSAPALVSGTATDGGDATVGGSTAGSHDAVQPIDPLVTVMQAISGTPPAGAGETAGQSGLQLQTTNASPLLAAATAQAESLVTDYLRQPGVNDALKGLFGPGVEPADGEWQASSDRFLATFEQQGLIVDIELRSSGDLLGALGAYAQEGAGGRPVIYLNADWLADSATTSADVTRVLVEEIGHRIDHAINGDRDTAGDEGDAFAAEIFGTGHSIRSEAATLSDHRLLTIDGREIPVETAVNGLVQTFFVPMTETDIFTSLKKLNSATTGPIISVTSLTVTTTGTRIVFDHWEDGYETSSANPVQATTQVWGDGDITNGYADLNGNGSFDAGEDSFTAGQVIVLRNSVDLALVGRDTNTGLAGNQFYFDGLDKISATAPITMTRAAWANTPGTVLAGAVDVYDVGNAGVTYTVPIGENTVTASPDAATSRLFEYTSLHIVATQDNTRLKVDKDGDGTFETIVTLRQGQSYLVNGGVRAGGRVVAEDALNGGATRPIEVYALAGDMGATYESRWMALQPVEQWSSSYYAPVFTSNSAALVNVFLYNPGSSAITVLYDTTTNKGLSVTVPAGGNAYVSMPTTASGAHFYTAGGQKFYAVSTIDSDAAGHAAWDWSYNLVPESYLTTKFVVGWAPGNGNANPSTATNGSPVWVTANADTTLYINYNGAGALTAPNGAQYDVAVTLKALESYRIFDSSDNNQSGLTAFTVNGALLAAAWGEDPSKAGGLLLLFLPWQFHASLPTMLQARDHRVLFPPAPAQVVRVLVTPEQWVEEGQTLFELASPDLEFQWAQINREIDITRAMLARQAASSDILDQASVLQSQLATHVATRDGLAAQRERLVIRAPFAGQLKDVPQGLREGLWLDVQSALGRLVSPANPVLVGYVTERELNRVHAGSEGVFAAEDISREPLRVRVVKLDSAAVSSMSDHAALSSTAGGPIAVREDKRRGQVPVEAQYRVWMEPVAGPVSAPRDVSPVLRGRVRLESDAASPVTALWRQAVTVLLRETGF
jgi:multidrug resistance efflux pump